MLARLAVVLLRLVAGGAIAPFAGAEAPATPIPEPGLPPVVWQLTAIALADGSQSVPDDPAAYTLQFLPDGMVVVQADCNRGQGRYAVAGSRLTIAPVAMTEVGCPPGSLGDEYVGRLGEVVSYAFDEDALLLALRDDAGSLRFAPTLTGIVWEWRAFRGGDGSEVVPDDPAKYALEFLDDGAIVLRADCNRGTGAYTVDGDRIDIGGIAMTEVGCPPGSLADRFVRDLDDVVSHVVREGTLYLALPADAGSYAFAARAVRGEATPPAG